jgi:CheY-like chemotaxis protein
MSARILVVDDNPTNLKLASDLLEMEGYEVDRAFDAEQALQAIERQPPALILMDIALPDIDGLTLTRQLKADIATRHICIVALTAYAMKGDDQKARDAGCDGYIAKPIDTRGLPIQIAEYLSHATDIRKADSETTC